MCGYDSVLFTAPQTASYNICAVTNFFWYLVICTRKFSQQATPQNGEDTVSNNLKQITFGKHTYVHTHTLFVLYKSLCYYK